MQKYLVTVCSVLAFGAFNARAAVLDDFNAGPGHFTSAVTLSGSNAGVGTTSAQTRISDGSEGPREGIGHIKIDLDITTAPVRLRFLSGSGTPANNTTITTSDLADGWFGYYLKTSAPGAWTTQPWLEGVSNNGGVEKSIINDGQWHLYEWHLDDFTGGPDAWGAVPSVNAGGLEVANGAHTLDSIFIRGGAVSSDNIFYLDFVAHNPNGSVAQLVPEPSTYALMAMGAAGLLWRVRRRK